MKPVLSGSSLKSREGSDSPSVWSFFWESSEHTDPRNSLKLHVAIDTNTGELVNYFLSDPSSLENQSKKLISREQAQQIAEVFLRQYASKHLSSISLQPDATSVTREPLPSKKHLFSYTRQVNGVPFPDDSIDLEVSPDGKVVDYSLKWHEDLIFPPATKKISLEEATNIFKQSPFLRLGYNVLFSKQDETIAPQLVYDYEPKLVINAITGQFVQEPPALFSDSSQKYIPVTNKPLAPLQKKTSLTQTQAVELAEKKLKLKDWKLTRVSYRKQYIKEIAAWELYFERNDPKDSNDEIEITLDARNGNVLNYTLLPFREKLSKENASKAPLAPEKLQKIALETVQRLAPYQAETLYLDVTKSNGEANKHEADEMNIHFKRYIQGMEVFPDTATVTLDQKTGNLLLFYSSAYQDNFPEHLPSHLSLEEAKEKWLQELEIKLSYQINNEENRSKEQQASTPPSITLVYTVQPSEKRLQQSYTLDAVTGKWINPYTNKLVELSRTEPGDLIKLPADKQKALRIMYEYNAIGLINEEIKPKEPIKRGEMIKMLVATISNGYYDDDDKYSFQKASFTDVPTNSTYFGVVEYALELGFISPSKNKVLQPEETITRAELADLFARALGYHSLAQLPNLFVSPTTDTASSKEKGSISIVTALGIMDTTNQSFKPDASITREEAAISFLKFLDVYNKRGAEEALLVPYRH
nr:YcdB/YcdC domain-containing protein [Brevibacillus laterosporus]